MPSRLERDIEEVLAQVDRFPKRKRSPLSRVRRALGNGAGSVGRAIAGLPRPKVNVGQVLLLGIIVVVVAYLFGNSIASRSLVELIILFGILLFLGAFVFSLRRRYSGGGSLGAPEKRWRGQPMDLSGPEGSDPWWKRWRSRR